MTIRPRFRLLSLLALIVVSCSSVPTVPSNEWLEVEPGVRYMHFERGELDVHITEIDLERPELRVAVSDERLRGTTVADAARAYNSIVAVNGDYFGENHRPVGLSIGTCGRWESAGSQRRQWILALAERRAEIMRPEQLHGPIPDWVEYAVSGWPILVEGCQALPSEEILGSDFFTRAPHPRTAVGIDEAGTKLILVVADGRRAGVPGPTLPELALFMREELGACSALNLDGGGSSEMVIDGTIVNVPSDGEERPVGNHLVVVHASNAECRE